MSARAYHFRAAPGELFQGAEASRSFRAPDRSAKHSQETQMDTTTLLIIVLIVVLLGGGGWYGRGRWY